MKRKIAAILAADIAGYSRLVAEDEEETLRRLGSYRAVFSDFVARHGGRIFNTAGDAMLAEFQSAVDAIRCAVDVQESLRTRNLAYAPSRHMSFRIGITIGDVVERDGDLLGDGVNIAARLESFAPAGGICISSSVHEAVTKKVSLKFDDVGLLQLKNIPDRVHAYTAALDKPERSRPAIPTAWRVIGIAAVLMIAVLGIGVYLLTRSSSGVRDTSPAIVAGEREKATVSQAESDSKVASPSNARAPESALEAADRKTAAADTNLAAPARTDETRPAAATAVGPAPASEQSSSTAPEPKVGADTGEEFCSRYLPSIGKTVEVPCEHAQDRAQEPEKAGDATEGGRTEVKVFKGRWASSESACKTSWRFKEFERQIIFGLGTAQYLRGADDFNCTGAKITEGSSASSLTASCISECRREPCTGTTVGGELSLHTSGEQLVGVGPDGQELQLRPCDAPEKTGEAAESGRTEVQIFMGRWATSDSACKKSDWTLNKNERRFIYFGTGTAQYLAPRLSDGDNTASSLCTNVMASKSGSAMSLTALCPKSHIDCKRPDCPSVSDPSGELSLHASGEQLVGVGPDGQELQLRPCD